MFLTQRYESNKYGPLKSMFPMNKALIKMYAMEIKYAILQKAMCKNWIVKIESKFWEL